MNQARKSSDVELLPSYVAGGGGCGGWWRYYGEGMHLQRDCHVVQYEAQNGGSLSYCPFPREFDPGLW